MWVSEFHPLKAALTFGRWFSVGESEEKRPIPSTL